MPYQYWTRGAQSPATYPPAARIQRKLRHQPGFSMPMTSHPNALRAVVFIDGQNLYGLAKAAWGNYGHPYNLPCYDARLLAEKPRRASRRPAIVGSPLLHRSHV